MSVEVETLSIGDPSHSFDRDRFEAVVNCLKGCKRVYVTKIGDRPADELKKIGIEPIVYEGSVEDIRKG
jgi:hypothetical protein